MSELQKIVKKEIASDKLSCVIYVKSIEVEFKEPPRRKRPVAISFKPDSEQEDCSPWFACGEEIDWRVDRRIASPSQISISVRKRHKVRDDRDIVNVSVNVDKLFMKPLVLINEPNGKKLSIKISCEVAGAFVDLICRLVEESQKRLASMKVFMERLATVCEALNLLLSISEPVAEVNPIAKSTISAVSLLYDFCKKMEECHEAASDLMGDIASFLPFTEIPLGCLKADITEKTVHDMLVLFEKIARSIIKYSTDRTLGGLLSVSDRVDEIDSYKEDFRKLKETLDWCIKTETWRTVLNVERHTEDMVLRDLGPVMNAFYESSETCFEGSRTNTLRVIEDWSSSETSPKLFWLYGFAGSGKTTIAHTVAKFFDAQNRLAGCFFCSRNGADRQNDKKILPTIAYQLSKWHKAYRLFIIDTLHGPGELKLHSGLERQFELLVKQPLSKLTVDLPPNHKPLVIVLDALDECCDLVESRRLLSSYVRRIAEVAPRLKVFVSGKKTPELEAGLKHENLWLFDIGDPYHVLQDDIAAYTKYLVKNRDLPSEGRDHLEYRASACFRKICRQLQIPSESRNEKDSSLNSAAVARLRLDALFRMILHIPFKEGSDIELASVARDILVILAYTKLTEPLTEDFLLFLSSRNIDKFYGAIHFLDPVIFTTNRGQLEFLFPRVLFLEFVSDRQRSQDVWIDPLLANARIAQQCLSVMHSELRFNICELESSYLKNNEIPDIEARIRKNIPSRLWYSCLNWIDHVLQTDDLQVLRKKKSLLTDFLCTLRVLYWIEVLCLIGALEIGKTILQKCAKHYKEDDHIADAATEWHKFISEFSDAIKTSTLHVYVSALTWSPPGSFVRSTCLGTLRIPLPLACEEAGDLRPRASSPEETILQRSGLRDGLHDASCIVFSRDGSRIASGHAGGGGSVQIWNVHTDEFLACGPLECHTDVINNVMFSPDDRRIITGSCNPTLMIWDAHTGDPVAQLEGHTDWVWAVAYSPDGKMIISGSWDRTVRIWDAQTGDPIGMPLEGHEEPVLSVAYSPNDNRIVSGSWDGTLRIWDAQSGTSVGEPLRGHEGSVWCMVYSTDGNRIISGSGDCTLRIWDAQTGHPVGEPMKGHNDYVQSVAYSPDGSRIISGSTDGTVRIWNAQNGAPVGVIPRDESRWDSHAGCFLSIRGWWPRRSNSCPPTAQALIHSNAPLYIPDDGWLRMLDGGLFIWVPPNYRRDVCCSGFRAEIDPALRFDWKKVPHGKDWTKIMDAGGGSEDH